MLNDTAATIDIPRCLTLRMRLSVHTDVDRQFAFQQHSYQTYPFLTPKPEKICDFLWEFLQQKKNAQRRICRNYSVTPKTQLECQALAKAG